MIPRVVGKSPTLKLFVRRRAHPRVGVPLCRCSPAALGWGSLGNRIPNQSAIGVPSCCLSKEMVRDLSAFTGPVVLSVVDANGSEVSPTSEEAVDLIGLD